jgi:hypothetical protein
MLSYAALQAGKKASAKPSIATTKKIIEIQAYNGYLAHGDFSSIFRLYPLVETSRKCV